jgi:peptidyl-Lys metalloendopeptidase
MAMADNTLEVRLSVQTAGPQVTATLEFLNPGRSSVPLWGELTGPGGRMSNDLFTITRDGAAIPYVGKLLKRPSPKADEFLSVESGKSVTSSVRLDSFYAFPPGGGEFTATYSAYNPDPAGGQLTFLQSNPVTFRA